MSNTLPHVRQDISVKGGAVTPPWYAWFSRIEEAVSAGGLTASGAQDAVRAIALILGSPDGTVENIPPPAGAVTLAGNLSVVAQGAGGGYTLTLRNDQPEPGAFAFYGTDEEGVRGFHPLAEALLAGEGIALTVTPERRTIISALDPLAEYLLAPDGEVLTAPDGSPFVVSERSTTNLPEGENLYFTEDRVRAVFPADTGWAPLTGAGKKGGGAVYAAPVISATPTQAEVQALADALQDAHRTIKAMADALIANGLLEP